MRKLLVLSTMYLVLSTVHTPQAHAACWCTNASADKCACAYDGRFTEPISSPNSSIVIPNDYKDGVTFPAEIGGIGVTCNTQQEANSITAVKNAVCQAAQGPEIIPYCARETTDTSRYNCYGRASLNESGLSDTDETLIASPNHQWLEPVKGPFKYNGVMFGDSSGDYKILVCDDNNFCCGRGGVCDDTTVPKFENYYRVCQPDATGVTPPTNVCGGGIGGQGESRLFIPGLKSVSFLGTLLQSIFNPRSVSVPIQGNRSFPSCTWSSVINFCDITPGSAYTCSDISQFAKACNAIPNQTDCQNYNKQNPIACDQLTKEVPLGKAQLTNKDSVTTNIQFHQGADDTTRVVNTSDNNSSLIVGQQAPDPLYTFGNTSDQNPLNDSGMCQIADVRTNPGDDLLGPKITARLRYTQRFEYDYLKKPPGCAEDNSETSQEANCCSFQASDGNIPAEKIVIPNPRSPATIRYKCGTVPGQRLPTAGRLNVFTKTPLVEYLYDTLVAGPQSVYNRVFYRDEDREFKDIPSSAQYSATGGDTLLVSGQTQPPQIFFSKVGSLYDYFLQGIQTALRPQGFGSGPLVGVGPSGPILGIECLSKGPADLLSDTTPPTTDKLTILISKIKTYVVANDPTWVRTKFIQNYQKIIDFGITNKINPIILLSFYLEETHGEAIGTYPLGCGTETTLDGSLACVASRPYLAKPLPEFMCIYADGHYPCDFQAHPNFVRNVFNYYNQLSSQDPICSTNESGSNHQTNSNIQPNQNTNQSLYPKISSLNICCNLQDPNSCTYEDVKKHLPDLPKNDNLYYFCGLPTTQCGTGLRCEGPQERLSTLNLQTVEDYINASAVEWVNSSNTVTTDILDSKDTGCCSTDNQCGNWNGKYSVCQQKNSACKSGASCMPQPPTDGSWKGSVCKSYGNIECKMSNYFCVGTEFHGYTTIDPFQYRCCDIQGCKLAPFYYPPGELTDTDKKIGPHDGLQPELNHFAACNDWLKSTDYPYCTQLDTGSCKPVPDWWTSGSPNSKQLCLLPNSTYPGQLCCKDPSPAGNPTTPYPPFPLIDQNKTPPTPTKLPYYSNPHACTCSTTKSNGTQIQLQDEQNTCISTTKISYCKCPYTAFGSVGKAFTMDCDKIGENGHPPGICEEPTDKFAYCKQGNIRIFPNNETLYCNQDNKCDSPWENVINCYSDCK